MIKNYKYYQLKNYNILKLFMIGMTCGLFIGIVISPLNWQDDFYRMLFLSIVFFGVIISVFLYLKTSKELFKFVFIALLALYFYSTFWFYPEWVIVLSLISIIPVIPIFLFHKIAFFTVFFTNIILVPCFLLIIYNTDLKNTFEYIAEAPMANLLSFLFVQFIILFLFLIVENKILSTQAHYQEDTKNQKVNVVGQLAASIAHEIRNPITVVKGYAQLLKETELKQKPYVHMMLEELEHTQEVIRDYLSLAKPRLDEEEVLQIKERIEEISQYFKKEIEEKQITLKLLFHQDVYVKMNGKDFKQVLVNLLKNSIEAMDHPGEITVEVREIAGEFAQIIIRDQGVGMDEEILEKLGTPFYTLKERGTGLGLTLVYSIITKYNGHIEVKSELHKGSVFYIYFPIFSPR